MYSCTYLLLKSQFNYVTLFFVVKNIAESLMTKKKKKTIKYEEKNETRRYAHIHIDLIVINKVEFIKDELYVRESASMGTKECRSYWPLEHRTPSATGVFYVYGHWACGGQCNEAAQRVFKGPSPIQRALSITAHTQPTERWFSKFQKFHFCV